VRHSLLPPAHGAGCCRQQVGQLRPRRPDEMQFVGRGKDEGADAWRGVPERGRRWPLWGTQSHSCRRQESVERRLPRGAHRQLERLVKGLPFGPGRVGDLFAVAGSGVAGAIGKEAGANATDRPEAQGQFQEAWYQALRLSQVLEVQGGPCCSAQQFRSFLKSMFRTDRGPDRYALADLPTKDLSAG
jgi:hypothetical protein